MELVVQVELVAAETALNHNQVQEVHQAQIPIQVQLTSEEVEVVPKQMEALLADPQLE